MHAVIRTGGKQYRVAEGDILRVEKLNAEAGSTIDLEEVLLLSDGETVTIGSPLLAGSKVTAEVQTQGRTDKIDVVKFKRRKKYRRLQGHRQDYTELKVTAISGVKAKAKKAAKSKTEAAPAEEAAPAKDDDKE